MCNLNFETIMTNATRLLKHLSKNADLLGRLAAPLRKTQVAADARLDALFAEPAPKRHRVPSSKNSWNPGWEVADVLEKQNGVEDDNNDDAEETDDEVSTDVEKMLLDDAQPS